MINRRNKEGRSVTRGASEGGKMGGKEEIG
jgi:hypothetical protein